MTRSSPAPTPTAAARPAASVHPLAALDELLGRRVSLRSLALLRVAVGAIALWHLWPMLRAALDGRSYLAAYHQPYVAWWPQPGPPWYTLLLATGAAAAVAMSLGWHTRVATAMTFVAVAGNLSLSTTLFHNNRAYLAIVVGLLALSPCGDEVSLDARRQGRHRPSETPPLAPAWPLWLLRAEASIVYGASGFSKLVDPDWWSGTVTWGRVSAVEGRLRTSVLPGPVVDLLVNRSFHTGAAKVVVLTELFLAVGLWWRATRYAAVWVAVVFHVAIQLSASVEVFSVLAVAMLLVWAVPSARDRVLRLDPADPAQRRLGVVVRRLDWLARFRIEEAAAGAPAEVVDRDGSVRTGRGASTFALSRLPLTAWFALPLLVLPSRRPRPPAPTGA